jgi:CheY-like chemotaxis protein
MMKNNRPILLVEDDKVDAMAVKRAVKDLNITNSLITVGDGEQALELLRDPDRAKPCLILLDINMPRMNGIEFLRVAKADQILRRIPVVVLTTSKEDQDKFDTFDLGVAGYLIKPADYMKFIEMLRAVDCYWTISEMPTEA